MIFSSLCFAKQVSFQIVQHDSSTDDVTEASLVIEDEILNTFFDYGYIVTNSAATVSASESQDEKLFKTGKNDAFTGYSDFFVQINLYYGRTEQTKTEQSDLQKVCFSVTSVKTGETFEKQSMENIKLNHTKDDLPRISADLVAAINKVLKSRKA